MPIPWAEPGWCDEAEAWIRDALRALGRSVTGAIESHHVRPWSTVLRVPTGDANLYFKATASALANDAALTRALAATGADCVRRPLAVDHRRGWMLLPDAGTPLRGLMQAGGDLTPWSAVLRRYAALQIAMAGRSDELLALGALDRRLAVLPAEYDRLVVEATALVEGQRRRLRDLSPAVATMCADLAARPIPETLQHDDLHDGNVFVRDGRYVIVDWGDASVAHPFATLTVTLRMIARGAGLDEDAVELVRLRDAYLEAWTSFAPREELLDSARVAMRLGRRGRALAWQRVASLGDPATGREAAEAVSAWLQRFVGDIG
jgi:hypothetical protein